MRSCRLRCRRRRLPAPRGEHALMVARERTRSRSMPRIHCLRLARRAGLLPGCSRGAGLLALAPDVVRHPRPVDGHLHARRLPRRPRSAVLPATRCCTPWRCMATARTCCTTTARPEDSCTSRRMRDDAPARALACAWPSTSPRGARDEVHPRRSRAIDACMALTDADPRSTTRSPRWWFRWPCIRLARPRRSASNPRRYFQTITAPRGPGEASCGS